MKDKDIKYYPQVLLEECSYKVFSNNRLILRVLNFQTLIPILSLVIVMDLKKRLMKILHKINNNLIINKSLILRINYALFMPF